MTKSILSACGAFISTLGAVANLAVFSTTDEGLCALLAVFFSFLALAFVGYGIEGSDIAEAISNFFSEKGGDHE